MGGALSWPCPPLPDPYLEGKSSACGATANDAFFRRPDASAAAAPRAAVAPAFEAPTVSELLFLTDDDIAEIGSGMTHIEKMRLEAALEALRDEGQSATAAAHLT